MVERVVPWRLIGALAAIIGAIVLLGLTVRSCTQAQQAGAQARLERAGADALANSASDAVSALDGAQDRAATIDQTTRENEDAIRSAPGADTPVPDGVHGAGLDSLCKRPAYQHDRQCVQRAAPR